MLIGSFTMIQKSFHSCLPFSNFNLVQAMVVFYNDVWTIFKFISKNLTHTLGSLISYGVAFTWHDQSMIQQMKIIMKGK
jgi:hypothetical protein